MDEIWKDVEGYEGLYKVSNKGNVRSITRYKKILTPHLDKDGYRYVKLKHKGTVKHARINRLVAIAFIPTDDRTLLVNHIDYNRQNDCVENLEWVTAQQNVRHSLCHYKGYNHKPVLQLDDGKVVNRFPSITEAGRATGTPLGNIVKCCKGDRQHAGGFGWEYDNCTGGKR